MLGRSAWGIFWMARYLERAENTARLLDAGFRMALTRGNTVASDEWRSVLVTLGMDDGYTGDMSGPAITNWLLRGAGNSGSVLSMMEAARTNARMVRTAITREVWEVTNESWMQLQSLLAKPVKDADLGHVLDVIRRQATSVRGAMEGTMLRNDIFNFARIGTHLERADNTARILDVKYHVLLPSAAWVGSRLDNAQWEMVLRSVAGERAFRWLHAGALDPKGIAQFLILDGRFPRSLTYCLRKLTSNMEWLCRDYHQETAAYRMQKEASDRLGKTTITDIFEHGLHEFITEFLATNRLVADAIAADYRFTE
ncbi:alpha-E domain-containing protein [Novosphingobium sp. SCN 63-17]|uniref:alpha-E domain-containing protein n=1 Tax=Novosphingobium sp. SCN 63-17 TaxID=1660120 RepID=UPI00086B0524|nr:alpha-E domain-containing protein [Novosphingobium sp. SCN 63-17]ODU82648.1 MAG: A alpha-helical domain with a conserved ER moti [Novosphingobium sp. SCN 63-17]